MTPKEISERIEKIATTWSRGLITSDEAIEAIHAAIRPEYLYLLERRKEAARELRKESRRK